MYCPKCEKKYTDGSLRCKQCNEKLIVRLPKKKVKKKKQFQTYHPPVNEKKSLFNWLFNLTFFTKHIGFYSITFIIILYVIYLAGTAIIFENMHLKDALLVSDIYDKIFLVPFLIMVAILLGYGAMDSKWYKKLEMKSKITTTIMKSMVIIFIFTAGINDIRKPILDYIYKDHYTSRGTVTDIRRGRRGFYTIYVDHKGYPYTHRLGYVVIGTTYTFTYSKRSHLILDIQVK